MSDYKIVEDLTDLQIEQILEAAIFAAGEPLSTAKLSQLFGEDNALETTQLKERLAALASRCDDRGVELVEVASGYRFQAKCEWAPWMQKMWEKRPPRYSRALLETLALIAYKQPITRGEIEQVRGVAVSSNIIKTLMEREWIKIVGYREVPGRPALLGSTRKFLDYFNLKSLTDMPLLDEITNLDEAAEELGSQLKLEIDAQEEVEQAQLEVLGEETSVVMQATTEASSIESFAQSEVSNPSESLIDESTINVKTDVADAMLQEISLESEPEVQLAESPSSAEQTKTVDPVIISNEEAVAHENKDEPASQKRQEIIEEELETV